MNKKNYYIVNTITFYRLIMTPVLLFLIYLGYQKTFGLMLAISFFTDLIDGYLAREFKVTSVFGSRLDSIADDLNMLCGIVGVFVFKYAFIKEHMWIVSALLALYLVQNLAAFIRYGKLSSFHTYAAKIAAVAQGTFLILLFLLPEPIHWLFYLAAFTSIIDLLEEFILVFMFPNWTTDVKGIFWVMRNR